MTPDERKMLENLADKIAKTPPPPKDAEAEEFIRTRIGNRPDALYLMTQTVLIQNLALQNAQQQIQDLQRSAQGGQLSSGSFLGQQSAPRSPGYTQPGPQQYAGPQPPLPQYAAPSPSAPSPGAGSTFLRGAAQTAAGVAAGSLAAAAIGSLFSHPSYGFGGGGSGFLGGGAPVEETVVNNYYDNPQDDYRADDQGSNFDNQNFDDSGQYDNSADFDNAVDDGGFDNSGGDDFV